LGLSLGLRFWV